VADDRFERLANLVTFLLDAERGATFAEILAVIPGYPEGEDARRRAFERDKKLLRDEDIPLVEEDGVYRIPPEEYYLPDLGLTDDEQLALQLAVAAVPGDESAGAALQKLAFTAGAGEGADLRAAAVADLDEHPLLPALHAAIRRRSTVTFVHSGTERTVEPALLFFRDGHWYLHAYDRAREAERSFRVDRIEGAVDVGPAGGFEGRQATGDGRSNDLHQGRWRGWLLGGDEPDTAVVRVDATMAAKAVADAGPTATVERGEDGSATITMPVVQRDAFRSWVLGLLDHAEVVAPPALRTDVVAWLRSIASAGGTA
jgi:predicted DNA-binding transcriptional regulator YafY